MVKNPLGKNFSALGLLRFALPNMVMMLCLSLYSIVDAIFISNYVSTSALSAVNIVYPAINLELGMGIMIAAGGSAIIARRMGEGKNEEAKGTFTFLVIMEALIGFIFMIVGLLFLRNIVLALGSGEELLGMGMDYLGTLLYFAPYYFIEVSFQTFFVTAGKPHIGLTAIILGGVTNVILDYVFMVPLSLGIKGAALATGIGYLVPAFIGLFYFFYNKKIVLHFSKPLFDAKDLGEACFNGSSEMVTNIALAVSTYLFNINFMHFYGEDGVAAITIVMYFQFVLNAILFGYASGVAPIISYKYGEDNTIELKKIHHHNMVFVLVVSLLSYVIGLLASDFVIGVFCERGSNVFNIAESGFPLYALAFIFMGVAIYASSLFTALSNGKISALISFIRTFLCQVIALIFMPVLWGTTGLWLALPAAELAGLLVGAYCLISFRKAYF